MIVFLLLYYLLTLSNIYWPRCSGPVSVSPQPFVMVWTQIRDAVVQAKTKVMNTFSDLKPRERMFVLIGLGCVVVFMSFFAWFHEPILHWMVEKSEDFREVNLGWLIIICMLIGVSFPPMMGYSAISMFTGMVFGFPGGWPILAAGTVIGSFACFMVFRYFLEDRAKALAHSNVKFMALAKTLEQDKFVLLWLIRLCPLPYSMSNAAMSSVHTVEPYKFFLATLCTTPKLLIHIFIGDRVAKLGAAKDTSSRVVNLISIVLAIVVAILTTWIIYRRTMERAAQIEASSGPESVLDDFEVDSDEDSQEYSHFA